MKTIFKTDIARNIFKIATIMGIAALLPQCFSNSGYAELKRESLSYLNESQVNFWKYRQDTYIRYLHTLANIMAGYEGIPSADRRDYYDNMLISSVISESGIVSIFTVWKPNALDGRDSRYIGRAGSNPSGQYALEIVKYPETHIRSYQDIDAVMDYLNGPYLREDRVENPVFEIISGREEFVVKMMVPVINNRTNEVTGVVGCLLNLASIQKEVEHIMMDYYEIAVMAVYSNNGMILGHAFPDRIGKKLIDVDTTFGPYIEDAGQAVLLGHDFYCSTYSPVLDQNLEVFMTPFNIGNSDTTWTVMIVVTESYFKRPGSLKFR